MNEPRKKVALTHAGKLRSALAIGARPENLRRTLWIAIVTGTVLTAINQGSTIMAGQVDSTTWVRIALNITVPFIVSNLGLLSGHVANVCSDELDADVPRRLGTEASPGESPT